MLALKFMVKLDQMTEEEDKYFKYKVKKFAIAILLIRGFKPSFLIKNLRFPKSTVYKVNKLVQEAERWLRRQKILK